MGDISTEAIERVDKMPRLAWILDPSGACEHFNVRCLEYYGIAPREATGWCWQWAVHPADLPQVRRAWQHSLQTRQPFEARCRLRRADGIYQWHFGHALPWYDRQGRFAGWIMTGTNVDALERRLAPQLVGV